MLRPFSPYTVAVAGGSRAQSLYVAVEGRRANGEQFQQGREVQLQAASSRLLDLEVTDITNQRLIRYLRIYSDFHYTISSFRSAILALVSTR